MNDKTNDIKQILLSAARENYRQLCSENNKFGDLKIFEDLFPEGIYQTTYQDFYAESEEGEVKPIQILFDEHQKEHVMLVGEGGIGKTTFLAYQMSTQLNDHVENPSIIPIYIELNRCPATIGNWYSPKKKRTNFILRYVHTLIDDNEFESCKEKKLSEIEKEFQKETEQPEYMLLLDGINEVNVAQASGMKSDCSIRELLKNEIEQMCKWKNIRIVLTTRQISNHYLPGNLKEIPLIGLGKQNIRDFLKASDYSNEETNWIEAHEELMDCLKIPLFLCMFACRNKNEKIKPLTRGEILYYFFHKGTPFYSEKKNIENSFAESENRRKQLQFTMDFILPSIGYCMRDRSLFSVSKKDLLKCIEDTFRDSLLTPVNEQYPVFPEYETEKSSLYDYKEIWKRLRPEEFLEIIVNILGVMNKDGNRYSFFHHHIRDYFAAYYLIQRIREAIALHQQGKNADEDLNTELMVKIRECLEPIYYEIPDDEIKIFCGEILGEHRNAAILDNNFKWCIPKPVVQEQTTLRNALNIYRFSAVDPKYMIRNIIDMMNLVRNTVAGENFDGLDLRNCRLYEVICSVGQGKSQLAASFQNCKINTKTFWFEGHIEPVRDFDILRTNPDILVTVGGDEQACVWNRNSKQMHALHIIGNTVGVGGWENERILSVNGYNRFITCFYDEQDRSFIRYIREDEELFLSDEEDDRIIDDVHFSVLGEYISGIWGRDTVRIFREEDGSLCYSYRYEKDGKVCHAWILDDENIILHVCLKDERTTKTSYLNSEWAFYRLNRTTGKLFLLYQYKTSRSIGSNFVFPLCAVSYDQTRCLIFENKSLICFYFKSGKQEVIDTFSDDLVPEYGEFTDTEGKQAFIIARKNIRKYEFGSNKIEIKHYQNTQIEGCQKMHGVGHHLYFISEEGIFCEYDLEYDVTEEYLPKVCLEIRKIHMDSDGHVLVEYSNNCILSFDSITDSMISTFFEREQEGRIEACTYLQRMKRYLIVIKNQNYEQILLYDPVLGKKDRIKVYFRDSFSYVDILETENCIYLAFTKTVICIDCVSLRQETVWQAEEGEQFFDFQIMTDKLLILNQATAVDRLPEYLVFQRKQDGSFSQTGTFPVVYVTCEEALEFAIEKDMECFGRDPFSEEDIYSAKGLLLVENRQLREKFLTLGFDLSDTVRFFVKICDSKSFKELLIWNKNFEVIEQKNRDSITTIVDYSMIYVYCRDNEGRFFRKFSFSLDGDEIRHAAGEMQGLYCSGYDEKIQKVDLNENKIQKTFSWLPGIIIAGCNFKNATISEDLIPVLRQHGGYGIESTRERI